MSSSAVQHFSTSAVQRVSRLGEQLLTFNLQLSG
jgi:hypothetical protein